MARVAPDLRSVRWRSHCSGGVGAWARKATFGATLGNGAL